MVRATALFFLVSIFSTLAKASDVPGGLIRDGENFKVNTYQLMISPSYASRAGVGGMSLGTEMRYQPYEELGVGFGFGAGQSGYDFGLNAVWHILPESSNQPAVALLGGLYFNREAGYNYFVPKVVPVASKSFPMSWGKLTPYAGMHFAPSFRLGQADNEFSIKTSLGTEWDIRSLSDLHLWVEANFGLLASASGIVFGLSYPFTAL